MTTRPGEGGPDGSDSDRALRAAVFDALPAQVAVIDDSGVIRATNRAWDAFAAQNGAADDQDWVGENYLAACQGGPPGTDGDSTPSAAASGIEAVLAGERETFELEYPCHAPDEQRWFTMRVLRMPDRPDHFVVMHVDITDRKLSELAVQDQNETLETVAGVLSHDLRNPMNVALARANRLGAESETDHATDAVLGADIVRSLERMDAIIDDALLLARDGADHDEVSVGLGPVATTAWEQVATADATLEVVSDRRFMADASLLRQLLENLFRNALDHADGESPAVTVGATPDGFFVADDGPGIPDDERDQVFEAGYTTNREDGGTGLGLSIVASVADTHGWTVAVTESESGGARFEFGGVETPETPAESPFQ